MNDLLFMNMYLMEWNRIYDGQDAGPPSELRPANDGEPEGERDDPSG